MGAFSNLLEEARARGVRRVTFEVDLDRPGALDQWSAVADEDVSLEFREGLGRTGEEALRDLVDELRKGA